MRKWYVSRDFQGGDFGMSYGSQSALDWLDTAVGWLDSDDAFESDDEMDNFISEWEGKINSGAEDEFMDWAADWWELEFTEDTDIVDEFVLKDYTKESEIVYDAKLISKQEGKDILIVRKGRKYFGVLTDNVVNDIDKYDHSEYTPRGWVTPNGRAFKRN